METTTPDALDVLRAYETWEGELILSDKAWAPNGMATLPRIPQALWDRLIEIQGMRNKILHPARRARVTLTTKD